MSNVKYLSLDQREPRLLRTAQASLGKLLRMYRERRRPRLTRLSLAELVGVSDKTVRNWEDDISLPSSTHLRKLVEVYLQQKLFTPGQEQAEAETLWHSRENLDERNTFPAFDSTWFQTLGQSRPTGLTSPAAPPDNLPKLTGPTIGRQAELARLEAWLQAPGPALITLSGPGGGGKTRVALQAGHDLAGKFRDGIFFICLAGINEPALVLEMVAQTLKVKETSNLSLLQSLQAYLHNKQVLLIIDNFEQVRRAGPDLLKLLDAAPELKIMVASRVALQVYGERVFEVPTLALPPDQELSDPKTNASVKGLSEYAAVQMLVERARRVKPDFQLTPENALALSQISRKLDGLPLALQLAAAHLKFFTPDALLRRLEGAYDSKPLDLLDKGTDSPSRQQSLRQTLDWSYNLLNPAEQHLFCTLGIFNDGASLAAVESVCSGLVGEKGLKIERGQVLNLLTQLVEQNLLRYETGPDGEPRFLMLETVREYALERLKASTLFEPLWQKYSHYLVELAQTRVARLDSPDSGQALQELEKEHNNLRGALQRALDTRQIALARQLITSLGIFWEKQGYLSERARWFKEFEQNL